MSEELMPFGVYYHEKKGFALLMKPEKAKRWTQWEIDKGKVVNHPISRFKVSLVREGTGAYFQKKELKGYEYWGEL